MNTVTNVMGAEAYQNHRAQMRDNRRPSVADYEHERQRAICGLRFVGQVLGCALVFTDFVILMGLAAIA